MSTVSGDGRSPSGPALPEPPLPIPPPPGPVRFPGPDVQWGPSPIRAEPPRRRGRLPVSIGIVALAVAGVGILVNSFGDSNDGGKGQLAADEVAGIPIGLRIVEQKGLDVTLAWEANTQGAKPRSFLVFRDGKKIEKLPGGRTTFVDKGLDPGATYAYTLAALGGGSLSSQTDAVSAQIPAMGLADARFGGSWTLSVRYTEAHGYSNVHSGGKETDYWSFAPVCNEGACDTKLRDSLSGPPWNLVLRKAGSVSSAASTEQMSTCNSTSVMGNVTVRIRVTRATVVDGLWRATRIAGTVVGSEGSKSVGEWYCPASGFSASMTGSLDR